MTKRTKEEEKGIRYYDIQIGNKALIGCRE
jgi:hypothetical protein